ncbi:glycosyltransferase [Aquabacterium sp.]|uniref:glycosyltransferase n=1 Tax=Aquabacterium sp. TaxID=1872578 RepID=UPI0035AF7EF4
MPHTTDKNIDAPIVFVWENFGPGHADRCDAAGIHFQGRRRVIGIEVFSKSQTYDWIPESGQHFEKITLFSNSRADNTPVVSRYLKTIRACVKYLGGDFLLCHYENPATLATALTLRLLGQRVFVMNDSKFDDYPRSLFREILKYFFYLPYMGGLSSGQRAKDYLRFLGVPVEKVKTHYNSLNIERIRRLGSAPQKSTSFHDKPFVVVARLVEKKNLFVVLFAFSVYRKTGGFRNLQIIGSGPLEKALQEHAANLGVNNHVEWSGFLQTNQVCSAVGDALALILISKEEQFGNVVIEALALGVPCIVSPQVGARDYLVRSFINGFIVEDDNATGLARLMHYIGSNEAQWKILSENCAEFAEVGHTTQFANAVDALTSKQP